MKFILGLLIWLIVIILFSLPLGILAIFKLIVTAVYKGRRRGQAEEWAPLSASDCMFAPDSSWVKPVVNFGAVMKISESEGAFFSVDQLRKHFWETFLQGESIEGGKYEKLSSYLMKRGAYVFRVHTNEIDLKDHIYEIEFDPKKNESLRGLVADWLLSGYKERKPCWEMIMVASGPGEMLLAFKIHHSLADGYSLLHIIDKLTGNSSPYIVRDFEYGVMKEIKDIIEAPMHFGGLKLPSDNPFQVVLSPDKKNEWMLSFASFPLEELKQFRRKHGVHMSSVIITMMIGAQKKFLEKDKGIKIPDQIAVATTIGWPRHPTRDASVLNRDKMCNHWATTLGKVSFQEDRIVLMKQVDKALEHFEDKGLHFFFKRIVNPLIWTLPVCLLEPMQPRSGIFAAGVTPIVGGDNYSLLGCPVENIHPYFAFHDLNPFMPASCFTFSHSGKLEVTLGVHPSVYKDQETLDRVLHEYCREEFNALMKC